MSNQSQATIAVTLLQVDFKIQQRIEDLNESIVESYVEVAQDGWPFPPITAFKDGDGLLWLADGFHRVEVAKRLHMEQIEADIRSGGRHDALLYAVGANHDNGLPRTNEDKRKAVKTVLDDPECADLSDRAVAELCKVGHPLVGAVRKEIQLTGISSSQTEAPPPQTEFASGNPGSSEMLESLPQARTKKARRTRNGRMYPYVG